MSDFVNDVNKNSVADSQKFPQCIWKGQFINMKPQFLLYVVIIARGYQAYLLQKHRGNDIFCILGCIHSLAAVPTNFEWWPTEWRNGMRSKRVRFKYILPMLYHVIKKAELENLWSIPSDGFTDALVATSPCTRRLGSPETRWAWISCIFDLVDYMFSGEEAFKKESQEVLWNSISTSTVNSIDLPDHEKSVARYSSMTDLPNQH